MPRKQQPPQQQPEQPKPRLLDTLSVVTAPAKPDPKAPASRVETPGLHEYVALSRVNSEVGGDKGHMKAHPIKALIMNRIFEIASGQGHGRDLNYSGIEGETTGSLQFRILNSDQKLTPEKVERLHAAGVRTDKKIIQPRALVVQYGDDDTVLEQIMQVLDAAGYDVKALFQHQREVAYDIVDPAHTLDDIFDKTKDIPDDERRELLEMVGYPMIMPQKFGGDLEDAWEITRRIVVPTEAEQAEDMAKAAEAAKAAPVPAATTPKITPKVAAAPPRQTEPPKTDLMLTLKASLAMENVVSGSTGAKTRSESRARGRSRPRA